MSNGARYDDGRAVFTNFSVAMLPMPLNSSTEKSTTAREYVGFPRKMLSRWSCEISMSRNPSPIAVKYE